MTYGIKDPRFLFTLEAWRPFLGEVLLIIVFREPGQVVASLRKREHAIYGREMSEIEAMEIERLYHAQAFKLTDPDVAVMTFPANMVPFLEAHCSNWDIPFVPEKAAAFYSESLVHQR